MIRVILVDDEKWSLYGLQHLIPWAEYDCEIVSTAANGQEALTECRRHKPDLLITDICMPDISGLDLAQTLLSELKELAVVFITGHEEIKYAQTAIRLGVFDYLLKPISAEDLTKLIEKYRQHVQSQRMQPSADIFFTLFDESNTASVAESIRWLSVPLKYEKNVRVLTMQYPPETSVRGETYIRSDLGEMVVFRTGRSQLTCFLFSDDPLTAEAVSDADAAIGAEKAQFIGISQNLTPESSFRTAYLQSCSALETAVFWKTGKIAVYQSEPDPMPQEALLRMKEIMKTGKPAAECVRSWLDSLRGMQLENLEKQVNEGLWLARRYMEGSSGTGSDFKLTLDEFEDFSQIEDYFLHLEDESTGENARANQTVQKVLDYLDEHYTEKINLTMIARKFYINPCYLSTLIHDYTGKTYSEIVTGKRMELVRSLLKNTHLPVTDIAEKAGYNVYSHFLNLFKRETGLPPSVWRTGASGSADSAGLESLSK